MLCGGEMRCWRHGDYTLAQDARQERACLKAKVTSAVWWGDEVLETWGLYTGTGR